MKIITKILTKKFTKIVTKIITKILLFLNILQIENNFKVLNLNNKKCSIEKYPEQIGRDWYLAINVVNFIEDSTMQPRT